MYECSDGFNLDSQCVLNCNQESAKLPILCTKEGLWTQEFKLCENLQGECPPPPSELNFVEYKCEKGYGIGAVCTPSCVIPPSDPVTLPENITADTLEYWMEPVRVQSIVCTGRRQWHPDPLLVHCIQSCEGIRGLQVGARMAGLELALVVPRVQYNAFPAVLPSLHPAHPLDPQPGLPGLLQSLCQM
ncbi:Hypothetical predicted protein [Marmota monax]|nr:hypothetical protein GHT09_009375 [Marmota monax]VTJ62237.1 Hypothetical predicted protein [Marmota monax]